MKPKQLLETHKGDPLAAAADCETAVTAILETVYPEVHINRYDIQNTNDIVSATIAHLGADGAEKWGRAVRYIVLWADLSDKDKLSFTSFARYWQYMKIIFETADLGSFAHVTRVVNATDRERLAACIVALVMEVEK